MKDKNNDIYITDKRRTNFYITDNIIYDSDLTACEFILYSAIVRYSKDNNAFLPMAAFAKRWKFSPSTVLKARNSLIKRGLICKSGKKTDRGAEYFDVAPVPQGIPTYSVGNSKNGSPIPQGIPTYSPGKTNNTYITRQECKTEKQEPKAEFDSLKQDSEKENQLQKLEKLLKGMIFNSELAK